MADRIQMARAYVASKPTDRFGLYTLAMELRKVQAWEECFGTFERLLSVYPDYGPAFYHFAMARKESGDRAGAATLARAGLAATLRSNDAKTHNELKDLISLLESPDEDED